jgi:hypothetical protein
MQTKILKVIAQGEPMYVQSKKSENGQLAKCYIRLKELGGDYEDEYICAMFGTLATCRFDVGKTVAASLRFQTHEANGAYYQDVIVNEVQYL